MLSASVFVLVPLFCSSENKLICGRVQGRVVYSVNRCATHCVIDDFLAYHQELCTVISTMFVFFRLLLKRRNKLRVACAVSSQFDERIKMAVLILIW